MSKHEIRLRRHKLTSHGADRFRNYSALLERHVQEQKMRKIFRVFGYFLVILIILILIVIVYRVEKRVAPRGPAQTASQESWAKAPFRVGSEPRPKGRGNSSALIATPFKAWTKIPVYTKDFSPAPPDHVR